jgi:hypothetical protein
MNIHQANYVKRNEPNRTENNKIENHEVVVPEISLGQHFAVNRPCMLVINCFS